MKNTNYNPEIMHQKWKTDKFIQYIQKHHKYYCKCGYPVIIYPPYTKDICDNCKHYVFISSKEEFRYRLEEKKRR